MNATLQSRSDAAPSSFAAAFGEALIQRRASLSWLRRRLVDSGNPVALSTLSLWRSGQRQPRGATSEAVVEEIERLLDLPPGRLTYRVAEPGRGVAARVTSRVEAGIRMLATDLGVFDESAMQVLAVHSVVDVGPDLHIASISRRLVVRARRDGVDRVVFVFALPELAEWHEVGTDRRPTTVDADRFTVVLGGSRGAVGRDDTGAVFGCAVRIDPPLEPGETSVHEVTFTVPSGADSAFYERTVHETARDQVMWVRFRPEALPARVTAFTDSVARSRTRVLPPSVTGCYHLAQRDFGPGIAGMHWER